MKTNDNRDWETAQAVLERAARAALERTPMDGTRADGTRADGTRAHKVPTEYEQDRRPQCEERMESRHSRRKDRQRQARRRAAYEFEALPLFTPASWRSMEFLTLGLGAVLIVGMFVAVARGIFWVILPGAATLVFAMISTQLRWERMGLVRSLQWQRARRIAAQNRSGRRGGAGTGTSATGTGGIVQLPGQRRRRTG